VRLLPLAVGRAAFTVAQYAGFLVALGLWRHDAAAAAATAIGASSWLFALARSGPEKAALLLLPRARRVGGDLLRYLRPLVLVIPLPFLAAAGIGGIVAPESPAVLWTAGAAYYLALGLNLVAVAAHRALGRPGRDIADYAVLTAGSMLFTVLVWRVGLGPWGFLSGQAALLWVLTFIQARGLRGGPRSRAGVGRVLLGNMVLLSFSDVLMGAGTSLLYVLMWVSGWTAQSDDFYRVGLGWTVLLAGVFFLQRLYQPRVSLRFAGERAAAGRAAAARAAGAAMVLSGCWLVAAGVVLARGLPSGPLLGWLVLLMVTRAPAFLLMSHAVYLMENAGGARGSAAGAVAGFLCVAVVGAAAVPVFGAAGAVYALGMKELVNGYVTRRIIKIPPKPAISD